MTRQYTYELCFLVGAMMFICSTVHEVDSFSLRMMSTTMPGTGKTAVIAGASGYIGKSVVRESVRQGYKTIALVRDKEKITSKQGAAMYGQFFEGADVVECDVTNPDQLTKVRTQNKNKHREELVL
jgi:short-subunit dehydrogenase